MSEFNWSLMENSINYMDKFKLIKFILSTNLYTQGKKVNEFEKKWSNWLGAKHSLFVTSGSTANFLLVAAVMERFGLKAGDKVLLPACTWMTNVAPPIQLGMKPIFCDVNLHNYSFDEIDLSKISKQHSDIKLIFVTHLLGIPAPYDLLKKYFPNAIIIDDVCESHGCHEDGVKIGSNSLGATFSFYFGHHMTSIEGGMISTNDEELYDLMKMKRSHGMARHSKYFEEYAKQNPKIEKSFLFVTDGYNFRNTELSAVLGMSQLERLDSFIEIRRNNYSMFCDIVNKHSSLFHTVYYNEGNSCFCFPLICKDTKTKNNLIKLLKEYKIEYRPVVGGNLTRQPFLLKNQVYRSYSNADIIHNNGVYIGNNQFINKKHILMLEKLIWGMYD